MITWCSESKEGNYVGSAVVFMYFIMLAGMLYFQTADVCLTACAHACLSGFEYLNVVFACVFI